MTRAPNARCNRANMSSPNIPRDRDVLRCSFCGKAQDEVRKLIAGPTVFICNECVEVCVDVVAADSTPESGLQDSADNQRLRSKAAAIFPNRSLTCSLCGKQSTEDMLPIETRGLLCGECADAIEDALRQGRPITWR
jgi:hypothetical protein